MKKVFFSFVILTSMFLQVRATGLVTNTNQSALFTRLQNRNASTGIDAVYYNPAGVTKLGNGFFVSLNNQTISQTKTVTTNFPFPASFFDKSREYVGDVRAPLYPGVYAAFNTGNLSFSLGFNPIGGGGGAKYKSGLPSFDMLLIQKGVSAIPGLLTASQIPTTKYGADILFEGTSVYFGYQANIAYKINDQISVGAGIRMVSAKNTYNGSIKILINPNYTAFGSQYTGIMNPASEFFQAGNVALTQLAQGSTSMAAGLTAAGLPPATPLTALSTEQQGQIATLLGPAGISTTGMNVGTAIATLNAVAPQYTTKAQAMADNATATQDIEVKDVEEKGTGFTPILSINYSPSDMFNFSVRYEFKTKLTLKTTVPQGKGAGLFENGKDKVADMPAMLAIGAEVKPIPGLAVSATFNTFFDKNVDYSNGGNIDMIKRNYLEYGLGVEYGITNKLRASVGWLATNTGVLPEYQNDQRFSSNSNSFGLGLGYRISPMIDINIGGQYSINSDYKKPYTLAPSVTYTETYGKKTFILGIGLDFYFGK